MALGRQGARQADLTVGWAGLPRSPGHAFHDRLQAVLVAAGFDRFAEEACAPCHASRRGRPPPPPGRHFRTRPVGPFEGTGSERGLEWRCADSLSPREFLRLGTTEPVPGHSRLSETRARLPLEVREAVLARVPQLLAEHGLVEGDRTGVDASATEADAALRAVVRRAGGETYRAMLERLAEEGGIATPTAEDPVRPGLSDAAWASPTDPEARIAEPKDGRTRLAREPGHAVDLGTGAIVAAEVHAAGRGDAARRAGGAGGGRGGASAGGPGRAGRRRGLPLPRRAEGPGGRGLGEPHRRGEGG